MIEGKFSVQNEEAVKRYCKDKLGLPLSIQTAYNKLYVAVWGYDRTMSYLEQQKLPAIYLENLIENEIKPTIQQWKENPPHRPQTKGKSITLPENMWLLDLLDYLS